MKKLLMSLIITALLCGCNSKITAKNETLVNGEKNISMNDVSFCVEKTDIRTEVKPINQVAIIIIMKKKMAFITMQLWDRLTIMVHIPFKQKKF